MYFHVARYLNGYQVPENVQFRVLQWWFDRVNRQIEEEQQNSNKMENSLRNMMG